MKWKVLPKKSSDLKIQLLQNRGINSPDEIEEFLNPNLSYYQKDLEIKDIDKAKKRILEAIKNQELIMIYGDYDVDGICATTICYKGLTSIGGKVMPFIPHRENHGYGLSKSGLDEIREKHPEAKLIITVDNGIVAIEQIEYGKRLGFEFIVTDHHLPLDQFPKQCTIVHSIGMCGTAVAWCLIRSLVLENDALDLLQFVAIGTVADQLPLVGLGRAFAFEGLRVLNKTTNPGLKALLHSAGISGKIGSYEVGHILGPRINAVGRLDHALPALKLLCTNNSLKALNLAADLGAANTDRQDITIRAIEEAMLQINSEKNIHVVYSRNWIPGVIGLIAARICEDQGKPVVAISVGEAVAKGSARSIAGVNIVESLREVKDLLIDVGGHSGAAGFSLESSKVQEFKERLESLVSIDKIIFEEKELLIEAWLNLSDINRSLLSVLDQFEPFGQSNSRPLFMSKQVRIGDIKTVGSGKHLKFKVINGTKVIDAIAFGQGQLSNLLTEGQVIDIAYNVELNIFNGRESIQLKIKDIHLN